MKTRNLIYVIASLALFFIGCSGDKGAQRPPNIMLITADDMNWNSVGVYMSTVSGTTPNIDRLAAEGIRFDYAYVPLAMCTPSRQIMLSGLHSHQTMTRGFTELERMGPAMPDLLKEHGYYIANINKQQDYYDWDQAITEEITSMGRDIPADVAAVEGIIDEAGDRPWFIMMNFNDPHRPFYDSKMERESEKYVALKSEGKLSTPSKVFMPDEINVPGFLPDLPEVRREMAQYYSSVRRCDDGVGAILEVLEERNLADNTILVFLSDHGISMPYSKLNCYQTSLRVPLIFRYPPVIASGLRDDQHVISTIDLAPTLLELAGIGVPDQMVGRSFVPLLEGETQSGRDYAIGYYYRNLRQVNMFPEFTVQTPEWVYIYNPWVDGKKEVHNSDYTHSETLAAIWAAADTVPSIRARSEFHKYRIIEELYNVRQDPHEYNNLAYESEFAPRVNEMREVLVDWMEATGHPALELMKDPYNQQLIDAYMAFEQKTAREEIDELLAIKKERKEK